MKLTKAVVAAIVVLVIMFAYYQSAYAGQSWSGVLAMEVY